MTLDAEIRVLASMGCNACEISTHLEVPVAEVVEVIRGEPPEDYEVLDYVRESVRKAKH